MPEKVILAGAGIGNKKNITLAAHEALEKADVIIYDRLLNQEIIQPYLGKKETYYVGKAASNHTLTQEQINELIVKRAHEGKKVVRLKGGDPYIFGRGSEEALFLKENGLDFEVLPGVTSGVVCLNTAGIPATHRNLSTSISFITGHHSKGSESNFHQYAKLEGTLVFYMGLNNLEMITRDLIEGGMDPNKSIAVIMNGAGNNQKTFVSTVSKVVEEIQGKGFGSPSLIVIGDTIDLRKDLNHFENRPLFGKSIAITRPLHQSSKLAEKLEDQGALVYKIPTISIEPIQLDQLEKDLEEFDYTHLLFTSANSVSIFFQTFLKKHDIRDLGLVKIAAIGKKTKQMIEKYHLKVDIFPDTYVGEAFVEAVEKSIDGSAKLYFPHSNISRKKIIEGLDKLGDLRELSIYQTVKPKEIMELPENLDAILFTSSSTVKNFVEIYGKDPLEKIRLYSIGSITSETIKDLGLSLYKESKEATIDSLVEALKEE